MTTAKRFVMVLVPGLVFALAAGAVAPVPTTDFGDAPDPTYPTLLTSNGARHEGLNGPVTWLGTVQPDGEADGQPNADATGDNVAGTDDEDGVTLPLPLIPGQSNTVTVRFQRPISTVPNVRASAWVDYNRNGSWADAGEQIANNFPPFTGAASGVTDRTVNFPVNVPLSARPGTTFARFRICAGAATCNTVTGSAANGEVEDYKAVIRSMDFGDAPDSYKTLYASNGARHVGDGPALGTLRDAEDEGAPSPNADGDDTTGLADEDGVTFTSAIVAGQTATVDVEVAVAGGLLDAWIDFNGNGSFQAFEQIFANHAVSTGTNSLSFAVPDPGFVFPRFDTFARFRISTAGGLGPVGPAATGEVEDYLVEIAPQTAGFKCYSVVNQPGTPPTPPRNVLLQDTTTGALFGSVATPAELCNPVDKDGEGINDPEAHLLCWVLRTPGPFSSRLVPALDQFGIENVRALFSITFCNPAYKDFEGCTVNAFGQTICDLPALAQRVNHYQCKLLGRRAGPLDPPPVLLTDQYSVDSLTEVLPAGLYCDPMATKNVQPVPVPHPNRDLKCYSILDLGGFTPRDVVVDDQFGRHTLRATVPTRLCEQAEED